MQRSCAAQENITLRPAIANMIKHRMERSHEPWRAEKAVADSYGPASDRRSRFSHWHAGCSTISQCTICEFTSGVDLAVNFPLLAAFRFVFFFLFFICTQSRIRYCEAMSRSNACGGALLSTPTDCEPPLRMSTMSDQWFNQKFDGGDIDENRHFIEGKWVAHGQKFSKKLDHKIAIFFIWSSRTLPKNWRGEWVKKYRFSYWKLVNMIKSLNLLGWKH